ncbi:hypothetical protein SAMN05443575_0155 [Jatrophihabitans endophyticus]|uniref:Uncharacterized protein n=1 Tax=Jatrophihabitans endophyticus TaxID=1206085 RepID=A0A1M5C9A0_9ACTN|nr:hypothetical protein [Jatrophihabitans endophyticus]SHF51308.1 hypothetical protein SAMN05443575_0155 [Jatrophihabitans endophyticus]
MFVVVLTDEGQQVVTPRAVGPFDDYDSAQQSANALRQQWEMEAGDAPTASVVHVEPPITGVVVGEMQ